MRIRRLLPQSKPSLLALCLLAIVVAVLTLALSPSLLRLSHYRIATAYSSEPGLGFDSGANGLLGGQANKNGTACLWIGAGSERTALVWPDHYYASGNPLSVVDEKGHALATVGQHVVLRGGLAPDGTSQALGCPNFNQQFLVAEVIETSK